MSIVTLCELSAVTSLRRQLRDFGVREFDPVVTVANFSDVTGELVYFA